MFDNIGNKVKGLALFVFVLGIAVSIIYGISVLDLNVGLGLLVILLGSVLSWIGSWITYAIGYIADRIYVLENLDKAVLPNTGTLPHTQMEKVMDEDNTLMEEHIQQEPVIPERPEILELKKKYSDIKAAHWNTLSGRKRKELELQMEEIKEEITKLTNE